MDHHIQPEKQISGVQHNLNASRVSFPLGFFPRLHLTGIILHLQRKKCI